MYCNKCGAKLGKGVKFCPNCGQSADNQERISAQNAVMINSVEATVRLYIAIAINIVTALMFILRWFEISILSIAGSIVDLPVPGKDGITIPGAFSAVKQAFEYSKTSDYAGGELIFLQIFLALLLAIPVINIVSAFLLFVKKRYARTVLIASGIYTLAATSLFIISVFMLNTFMSNSDDSGALTAIMGMSIKAPAYITALLGLASVFAIQKHQAMSTQTIEIGAKPISYKSDGMVKEKRIGSLSIVPFLPTIIAQFVYDFIDMLLAGRALGSVAVAGISVSSWVTRLCTVIAAGLSFCLYAIISRKKKSNSTQTIIIFSMVVAVLVTLLVQILSNHILAWSNTPAEAFESAMRHMRCVNFGLLFVFAYNALAAINYGKGHRGSPFVSISIAVIMKLVFSGLLVYLVSFGVFGLALATLIAQALSVAVYALYTVIKAKA